MQYLCERCAGSFNAPPSQKARFCGRTCYNKSREGHFTCDSCSAPFIYFKSHKRGKHVFCSAQCQLEYMQHENHPRWRGGVRVSTGGYRFIYVPDHPYAVNNLVREHRLVMEKYIGRYLLPEEIVHHKNEDKLDNRIENLVIVTRAEHVRIHTPRRRRKLLTLK